MSGHLGAATSTGGLEGKPPGRVGDSAIIGAGTWADDETVAVSATGVGEAFILAGFAHRVDWLTRSGTDLSEALPSLLLVRFPPQRERRGHRPHAFGAFRGHVGYPSDGTRMEERHRDGRARLNQAGEGPSRRSSSDQAV